MGLALEVGILADLRQNDEEGYEYFCSQFQTINQYLQSVSLPLHREPEDCAVWSCGMLGYSGLHYLRRIAAHLDLNGQLVSPGNHENTRDDPALNDYYSLLGNGSYDHLIQHSDAEGYYLPIALTEVLYTEQPLGIAGGIIGSSVNLLRECEQLAAVLGIPAALTENSSELRQAAMSQGEGSTLWQRYGVESYICVCLMQGCRAAIAANAALVFC
jgi:hypothetical protein